MILMTQTHQMTVIIDTSDAGAKNITKKDPIRACATLAANLLTTAFKSKMIRFKLDEDPLQRRIYFLTFIEEQETSQERPYPCMCNFSG